MTQTVKYDLALGAPSLWILGKCQSVVKVEEFGSTYFFVSRRKFFCRKLFHLYPLLVKY